MPDLRPDFHWILGKDNFRSLRVLPVASESSGPEVKTDPAKSAERRARRTERVAQCDSIAAMVREDLGLPPKSPQDSLQGRLASSFVAWAIRKPKRPRKAKRKKSPSVSKLEAILWDVFATFIKIRDKRANNGLCFYCDFRPIDSAMHRIKRGKRATKYDERNCHGGCHSCNFEDNHNPQKFDAIFIRKCGVELFLELETKSREFCPRTRGGILDKTEYYKRKISAGEWT